MVLGALPLMLDSTIVNVAINSLAQIFKSDISVMQWTVTTYVLAMAVAVPFSGWLIQRFDGKHIYLGSLSLFMLGSLLAGLAWNAAALIAFRVLQGFAAGIMLPLLSTLAVRMAGNDNLGKLMSLVGIPVVFAPIIGPVAGGLIMQFLPWQWLFLINLPIGAIGLLGLKWKLPSFPATAKAARMDWLGVVLLALASGSLIFGVTQLVKAHQIGVGIFLLVLGAATLCAYILYAAKCKSRALISLDLFRSRNFSAAFAALFLAGFATNGPLLLLPLFFQNVQGQSVIMAALWLIPQGLGMLVTRPLVGSSTDKLGAKLVVLPALLLTFIGTLPFVFFTATTPAWLVWAVLLVRGAGLGGILVPLMADCYFGLEPHEVPVASVATRIIQNIGSAFGSAVLASVVSLVLASPTGSVAAAYHAGFLVSLVFMLVSVVPALFLTNRLR